MSLADNIVYDAIKNNHNIRWIITTHGEYELYKNTMFINKLIKKLESRCNHLIYTADKNILKTPLNEVKVPKAKIYIGVNTFNKNKIDNVLDDFSKFQNDFIFCMIARGIPEKGWEIAIDAFKKLHSEHSSTSLILIGNGDYLKNLVNSQQHSKIKLIQLTSNIMDYTKYIPVSNAGLLPTYFPGESVPTVIAEFITAGVPVIASDIGEIKNMLLADTHSAGLLIPVDSQEKMTENLYLQMKLLLENKALYQELKENTKAAGEKFDIDNIAQQYLNLFKHLN